MLVETPPGKESTVVHNGLAYERYMVRTQRLDPGSDLTYELSEAVGDFLQDGDFVCVAESVVAITQGRAYKITEIKPGLTARLLSRFVNQSPAGIGLALPETMQLAVQEVGAPRLYLAALVSALTQSVGRRGDFYRLAGPRVRGIDGPTAGTLPPYNEYATLIPQNPRQVVLDVMQSLRETKKVEVEVVIVDANDLGVNILAPRNRAQRKLATALCQDNPMGQGHEQTPVMIARKVG